MNTWPAPAKINLFLHVVGRRTDGYHQLQTAFQFLDYGDDLTLHVTGDGRIMRTHELPGITPAADLSLRAARLLKDASGCSAGVEIGVAKRLPTGAGLGGGSSDAATTLIALNRLWRTGLSIAELAALGLKLGADIPVFIHGQAAWAEGVGEVLTPVELPEPWYLVAVPPVSVSTAEIFQEFARHRGLTPYTPPRTIRDLRAGYLGNDLEPVVRRRYPDIARCFELLAPHVQQGDRPRMTGSGGGVFIAVADMAAGKRILDRLPEGFTGFVARAMNRHPLYGGATDRQG